MLRKKNSSGISLPEVLVALVIVSLATMGVIRAITVSMKNASFSQSKNKASSLGQEKIGEIINVKNSNPAAFFTSLPVPAYGFSDNTNQFCLKTTVVDSSAGVSSLIPTDSPRYLTAKMAKIVVEIFWNWKGAVAVTCNSTYASPTYYEHSAKVETYVTN